MKLCHEAASTIQPPRLVSHHLCPYVQRAAIVAAEKGIVLERCYIDLGAKPGWFLAISPTGKVPLLQVRNEHGVPHVLFESAVICEYLDETSPGRLLPSGPLDRAQHRAWVEFASAILSDIAGLYSAREAEGFATRRRMLETRFDRLEANLRGPWFGGEAFGLVDAAFGPVFRYLDAFERLAALHLANGLATVGAWRAALAARPSVARAVAADYPERLASFLLARGSHLSMLIRSTVST